MKLLARTIVAALLFVSQIACTSNEIGLSKDVNPETVYMDYSILYNGGDSVTCHLQYRFAGENGTTLILSEPSKVEIDGSLITVDSSSFSGAYYQKNFAINSFKGDHEISFTDVNGKTITEKFNFHNVQVENIEPVIYTQNEMVLKFKDAQEEDVVEINIADTSNETNDLNIRSKLVNNKLIITPAQLQQLKPGTCKFSIFQTEERPLKTSTLQGGRINTTYLVKEMQLELDKNDKIASIK